MKEPVHRDLHSRNYPVDEDMVLQRKVWRFERWGWYGLVVLIGEATQQALLGDDFSLTNAVLVIATLIAIDIGFSLGKQRSRWFSRLLDGGPTIVVEHGNVLHERLKRARLDESDILEAARSAQGIVEINQIKFAILERNGKISVIPSE